MIQEYRKASAEWMGFTFCDDWYQNYQLNVYLSNGKFVCNIVDWQPDLKKNADQCEMIEDLLVKQKVAIEIHSPFKKLYWDEWRITMFTFRGKVVREYDKSKPIAFMKAFMEWQRKEEG